MDYQCATALEGKENNSYITKTLTFPTSGPNLRDKQSEFQKKKKKNVYSRSLLTQDHVHVFIFRFHQILRKL